MGDLGKILRRQTNIGFNDPDKEISLVYIDDVVTNFKSLLYARPSTDIYYIVEPIYKIKVGDLVDVIKSFNIHPDLLLKLHKTYNLKPNNHKKTSELTNRLSHNFRKK